MSKIDEKAFRIAVAELSPAFREVARNVFEKYKAAKAQEAPAPTEDSREAQDAAFLAEWKKQFSNPFLEIATAKSGGMAWAKWGWQAALTYASTRPQQGEVATTADYEHTLADHRRLVRELDVALNGENAAPQASLCDIVHQVKHEGIKALRPQAAPVGEVVEADMKHDFLAGFNPSREWRSTATIPASTRMGEWQSIESAPRDGSCFVATNGKLAFRTKWQRYHENYLHQNGGPTYHYSWSAEESDSHFSWNPTHWMPLPTPPQPQEAAGGEGEV